MPAEGCHHRYHPKTSGIPGARPVELSCRKPTALVDCQEPRDTGQATLKLISATTTLYGPIHLNQSCYLGNEPRWRISLRSNYPLCLLHLSLPASPQALILLSVPSCSGAAPLPQRETFQNRRALSALDSLTRAIDGCCGVRYSGSYQWQKGVPQSAASEANTGKQWNQLRAAVSFN